MELDDSLVQCLARLVMQGQSLVRLRPSGHSCHMNQISPHTSKALFKALRPFFNTPPTTLNSTHVNAGNSTATYFEIGPLLIKYSRPALSAYARKAQPIESATITLLA